MKNIIIQILKEEVNNEPSVIIAGIELVVDNYVSSHKEHTDIFLIKDGELLNMEEYSRIEEELASVGIVHVSPQSYRRSSGFRGDIEYVKTIRVRLDIKEIVKIYLDGALSTRGSI
jgi:hypothetical protein